MNPFKGRHFQRDIILWAVRWYCKYGISYRELQEMLAERGVKDRRHDRNQYSPSQAGMGHAQEGRSLILHRPGSIQRGNGDEST
ncbi:hypothetical protein AM469_006230 [Pseudomonas aeruginosa]|nr:hypothetical protein AM469_006230 [Pseudomonas aeruginosa]